MSTCTQCGTPMTDDSAEGLCGRCLLSVAMKTAEPEIADVDATLGSSPRGNVAVGNQIGPIRLLRMLGKGGMGEVWLGSHELLGRKVAVKFLTREALDRAFATFIQEARAAAAVEHPGLNKIHNADVVDGVPYLVLELLDGPNLADLVARSGPLDLPAARAVLEEVGEAVAELNQKNLVHRDIKPSNIVLTCDGRVVLTDFGLACARPAAGTDGGKGLAGTPAYMAPEMFDGVISAKTDVYALGMTACVLLSGRPASAEPNRKESRGEGPEFDIDTLCAAGVPQEVADVLVRATSKDPLYRPKSAWHLLAAFRTAFDAAGVRRASREELVRMLKTRTGSSSAADAGVGSPSLSGGSSEAVSQLIERKRASRASVAPTPVSPPAATLAAKPKRTKRAIRRTGRFGWLGRQVRYVRRALRMDVRKLKERRSNVSGGPVPPAGSTPTLFCGKCHYCIQGLATSICPECGSDLGVVGTATPKRRPWWRLARYALAWLFISAIAMEFVSAALSRWAIPYTHHQHLYRLISIFATVSGSHPTGSNVGGDLQVDQMGDKISWGMHPEYAPAPVTDMNLTYVGTYVGTVWKTSLLMHVDLKTGGYSYTDAAGKRVSAPSGFDANVLLQWLSAQGWKPADPKDQATARAMMTYINEMSAANASQEPVTAPLPAWRPDYARPGQFIKSDQPVTVQVPGTAFSITALPPMMVYPTGAASNIQPPAWFYPSRVPVWLAVWLMGIRWLAPRLGWKVRTGRPGLAMRCGRLLGKTIRWVRPAGAQAKRG